jgi:hypothetical protein
VPDSPNPGKPTEHPGRDDAPILRDVAVHSDRQVHLPIWTRPTPIRAALTRWLHDTRLSLALSLFLPIIVLGIISWFPAVSHNEVLRALPLAALVLYLALLIGNLVNAVLGRPSIDLFARRIRRPTIYEPQFGRTIVQLIVALFCLPALTVFALRAPVLSLLIVSLTVLPMLMYALSIGVASVYWGLTVICITMLPPVPERVTSGDESGPNRR